MDYTEEHYNEILGLDAGWSVSSVKLDMENHRIEVTVEVTETSCFCGHCETLGPIYVYGKWREWRHMDVMQMGCYILCRVPGVVRQQHKRRVALTDPGWFARRVSALRA